MQLTGMTWNHPRGYDPLVAASHAWRERTGVAIEWDRRSLQDFESYPVRVLAERYDLIVIDHPHVGQVTAEACLQPFDLTAVGEIAQASLGGSFESYHLQGRQWALPIDAAAQVQAWRPDLLAAPPASWRQVMRLAAEGRIACPLRPPHSLMSLYTLVGLLGGTPQVGGPDLFEPERAAVAYHLLAALADCLGGHAFDQDPIDVLEHMAEGGAGIVASPLVYGYVSYAHDGFRPARIAFADLAPVGEAGPRGSALGGTGLAVSALRDQAEQATAFASWVAGRTVQAGLYAQAGGQPGHAAAWEADAVNAPAHDFYRATRTTLDQAWLRPRHNGYMAFQGAASERLNHGLRSNEQADPVIADLNRLFRQSL